MQDFLVLGLVPGTDIQINFSLWLMVVTVLSGCVLIAFILRRRSSIMNRVLAHRINRVLKHTAPYQV